MKRYINKEIFSDGNLKALALMVIVIWSGLITFTFFALSHPMVSTSYYHANIQFRAGNEQAYEDIFNQSIRHIVQMYDRHPNWKWTLECQGLLIQMAFEHPQWRDIFDMIQEQNQRGQLELIVPQYSDALISAYNYKDFAESINYTHHLLEDEYNLTISNVFVMQEGQYLPAFPLIKQFGLDTIIVSRDQLSYQNYYPHQPILNYSFAGIQANVMPVAWLPCYEAGVFHHELALSDAERTNTGGIEGPFEFNYNPDKMKQIELRHIELEKKGNIFMNMSEWVKHCIDHGYVEDMGKFMPESNWTPNRHQSVSRWMAWGNGASDDGLVLARNYYTRNLIHATEIMSQFAYSSGLITAQNYSYCKNKTDLALVHIWLSQVTDTTGVNPNQMEFEYMINNTYIAQSLCKDIINFLKSHIPAWSSKIQVDSYDRKIIPYSNPSDLMNISINSKIPYGTSVINGKNISSILSDKYGLNYSVDYDHESLAPHLESYENQNITCKLNNTFYSFNIDVLRFKFKSHRDQEISNEIYPLPNYNDSALFNGESTEQHMFFFDDWNTIYYSPSIAENYTQKLVRDDYRNEAMKDNDFYIVPLPIANGFIYNPQKHYAIITNNTVRHISVKWENNYLEYYETEQKYNSTYEFILFKGDLADSHLLANIINPYPFMIL
ncbi:MAG: hypothetical protein ACTSVC_05590 [Promethearchaeota archaeon]